MEKLLPAVVKIIAHGHAIVWSEVGAFVVVILAACAAKSAVEEYIKRR